MLGKVSPYALWMLDDEPKHSGNCVRLMYALYSDGLVTGGIKAKFFLPAK